ncbi:MAG TPA: VOC family protein [Candidatus Dormibacteraeota bacterium]|nr:VOC family protein [Candidatus Dormibacteraeota bacterium]
MATRFDHLILPVNDCRASLDFYFRVLGVTDEGATERRI